MVKTKTKSIGSTNLPTARTRATVDRAMKMRTMTPAPSAGMHPYLACKYMPFHTDKNAKGYIPDGRGKNILLRDYKTTYDIQATLPFSARISPTFPCPVRFYQGDATVDSFKVNSQAIKANSLSKPPTGATHTTGVWYTGGNMLRHLTAANASDTNLNISSGRCVSVGYRLVYTGNAANANGLLIVDTVPEKVDAYAPANLSQIAFVQGDGNLGGIVGENKAPLMTIDTIGGVEIANAVPADQYVGRPENGLHGVLKSRVRGNNHEFRPWYEKAFVPTSDYDNASSSTGTIALAASPELNSLSPTAAVGLNFWDDQLESVNIRVNSIGSFRLEIISCFEFEYPPSSSIIDLTTDSPKINDPVLKMDDTMAKLAVARPFSQPLVPGRPTRPIVKLVVDQPTSAGSKQQPKPQRKSK